MKNVVLISILLYSSFAFSQDKKSGSKTKECYVVLLKKGPNQNQDDLTLQKMQEWHTEYINKLVKAGKVSVAGTFGEDTGWLGLLIFKTRSVEETKVLIEEDPMLKSGRVVYEMQPLSLMKGTALE